MTYIVECLSALKCKRLCQLYVAVKSRTYILLCLKMICNEIEILLDKVLYLLFFNFLNVLYYQCIPIILVNNKKLKEAYVIYI